MSRIVPGLLLSMCALPAFAGQAEGAPVAAAPDLGRWREHEVSFTYSGFTSKYSCDGLADKLKWLLRTLGARKDFSVTTGGCPEPFGGPTEFPRAQLRFATLEPGTGEPLADSSPQSEPRTAAPVVGHVIGREAPRLPPPAPAAIGGTAARVSGEPSPGQWQLVQFDRRRPRSLDPGDCELLEQFRDRLLPLFATRALVDGIRCIPYQIAGTQLKLSVEVFAPPPSADTATAPPRGR